VPGVAAPEVILLYLQNAYRPVSPAFHLPKISTISNEDYSLAQDKWR
jgi:hypothetical protein